MNDTEPVHPIKAGCPVCDSMSLRAFPERELIACINPACRCEDDNCECQQGRRHRWRREQWTWLGQVIGVELEQAVPSLTAHRVGAAAEGVNSRVGLIADREAS